MKPVKKEDMPKLYAMGGLALVVFGYAIFSFTSGNTPTPAVASSTAKEGAKVTPAAATATTAAGGASAVKAAVNTAEGAPAGKPGVAGAAGAVGATGNPAMPFDVALVGPPTGGKDPFMPVGAAAAKTVPMTVPSTAPSLPAVHKAPTPRTGLDKLLDLVTPQVKGTPNPASGPGGAAVVVLPPPPPPDVTVTGVVIGDISNGAARNVAILRGKNTGTEDRRFVSIGDYVGNGFTVAAVHADGVDIKDKSGRNVTIKLGSSGETPRAK